MGLIDKIYKITRSVDNITSIASNLEGSNLLKGINLESLDFNNLGSIGSSIQSSLNSVTSDLTSGISNVIDVNEIQNLASSISPSDVGLDLSNIESQLNNLNLNDLDIDIDDFDLGSLGLDKIKFL